MAKEANAIPSRLLVLIKQVFGFVNARGLVDYKIDIFILNEALQYLGYSQSPRSDLASRLQSLSGPEFENFVAEYFRQKGFVTELTSYTGDHGIDIVIQRGVKRLIVQCKQWAKPVGEPVIRDFYGSLLDSGAEGGIVVTTSTFTLQAKEFAQGKNIQLIDLDALVRSI